MPQEKQVVKVGRNYWNYSGKVVKKNEKYTQNGNLIVSVMLKVPAQNPKYSTTVWLKAFNSAQDPSKNVADQIVEKVADNSNYSFSGYLTVRSYDKVDEKTGETKKQYAQDFVINKFEVAEGEVDTEVKTQDEEVPF